MSFPVDVLRPGDTALCLCCAAFLGAQDAAYLRDFGLTDVTCIDRDAVTLVPMQEHYPATWTFMPGDVFKFFAELPFDESEWSIVTIDPWTGEMDRRVRAILPQMWAVTKRVLIVGVGNADVKETMEAMAKLHHATGLRRIERSKLSSWIVAEKS